MASTAQFAQFVLDTETVGAGWKLYHYNPGLLTTKDVWEQRAKSTTAAQPLVADENGVVSGYFDGLYDLAVYNSDDELVYTWSSVSFFDEQSGQVSFPGTQNPSVDPNTLDDYEEGTWTPVLTFATPGDLSVSYALQVGQYTKIGRLVTVTFQILTSAFTHTTASGNARITGLPFTCSAAALWPGALYFGGITMANYTQFVAMGIQSTTRLEIYASGQGQSASSVASGQMPTGGTVALYGTVTYEAL